MATIPSKPGMFSYLSPEERVPATHPLRPIRQYVDTALTALSPQLARCMPDTGRPSIAPEKLLRALLLQVLYSLRSERLLMEQLEYNLLFRWFVGLDLDAPVWDVTVFTKNRDRLLAGQVATAFFEQVLAQAKAHRLLSDEHFTVDGTLIEAWAGQKSFKQKTDAAPVPPPDDPGNPSVDFRGERRTNATHASTTDPEARLYKKAAGQEAKLCFLGHVLMENRHGLVVNTRLTQATGTAEREAALALLRERPGRQRVTLGGDKNYDTQAFVQDLRALQVTPHVAQHTTNRASAIDGRTTRHPGYAVSQQKRKRVEEIFGWLKTVGLLRKVKLRGVRRVGWLFTFAAAVVQPGADAQSRGGRRMSRHDPAARTVAPSRPPRWDATPSRMGVDGSYDWAVSMTKCKKRSMMLPEIERIRGEQLCGTFEAQRLAWPSIQLPGNRIQLFLREATQVAALGQILPQQAVGVLVDAALPGTVRIGEVDFHPGGFRQPVMRCHFPALIVRQRQTPLRLDPIQHMTESAQRRLSTGVVHPGQYREQGGALHQRPDSRAVLRPLDEITFPVPRISRASTSGGRA